MKNNLISTIALIAGVLTFFVSEFFYAELILINATISLVAFVFTPYIINKLVDLKYHFSSIYLVFFGLYIAVTFLSQLLGLNIYLISNIVRILVVLAFLILTYLYSLKVFENHKNEAEWLHTTGKKYIGLLIVGVLAALFINFVVIRQPNSIVALDLLQHQSVVNQVYTDVKICLFPSQCNNLFLKDGYTTLYHSILFFVSPPDNFIQQRIFNLDIAWVIVSSISIFIFARKFIQDRLALALASFIGLLTFVNGAYEFSFFIPQAFVFFIFLTSYTKEKLSRIKLISLIAIMVLTHFIIGAYLSVFLLILEGLKRKFINVRSLTFVGLLGVIFTALLSAYELTFETLLQADEIRFLGITTNKVFPQNILELVNMNPVLIVCLFAISILVLLGRLKDRSTTILVPIALTSISIYFLAPTYANKFLIGVGLYTAIVVCDLIFAFVKEQRKLIGTVAVLTLLSLWAFINNYNAILTFYRTSEQSVSALNEKEFGVVDFFRKADLECVVVTDPFSQIVITGLTRFETAQAQYMNTEYRQIIHSFLQNPTQAKLSSVLTYPGYENICFVYTYRFEESRVEKIDTWANQLYYYVVNSPKELTSTIEPIKILNDRMDLVYKDKYYYVFK
jgi:hypothetical protein